MIANEHDLFNMENNEPTGTVKVSCEMTCAIAQFENLKPRIEVECQAKDVEQVMDWLRAQQRIQYKRVKE